PHQNFFAAQDRRVRALSTKPRSCRPGALTRRPNLLQLQPSIAIYSHLQLSIPTNVACSPEGRFPFLPAIFLPTSFCLGILGKFPFPLARPCVSFCASGSL